MIILKLSAKNRHIQYSLGPLERQYAELLLLFAVICFLISAFVIAPITGGVLLALGPPLSVGHATVPDSPFQSLYSFICFGSSNPPPFSLSPDSSWSSPPPPSDSR
ncbi:MAG: hypothetical protein ACKVG6_00745 [Alphaproteobacteria bacterium]